MFLPQVALAITMSLLGAGLARRISTKRVYLLGLSCSIVSMVLLLASTLVKSNQSAAYPLLLASACRRSSVSPRSSLRRWHCRASSSPTVDLSQPGFRPPNHGRVGRRARPARYSQTPS